MSEQKTTTKTMEKAAEAAAVQVKGTRKRKPVRTCRHDMHTTITTSTTALCRYRYLCRLSDRRKEPTRWKIKFSRLLSWTASSPSSLFSLCSLSYAYTSYFPMERDRTVKVKSTHTKHSQSILVREKYWFAKGLLKLSAFVRFAYPLTIFIAYCI